MKINYYYTIAFRKSIALILLAFAISFTSNAQSNITDYVLFGGFGTCPTGANAPLAPGCAVQLGSNNTITGTGAIGSYTLIQSTGNASTGGSLYSNGKINLSNNNTIAGRVVAANKNNVSGTIFQATSGVNIGGNVDVNGNIVLAGGSIAGKVTQSSGTYSGPTPALGYFPNTAISAPALPAMPSIKAINIGTVTTDYSNNKSIGPGTYRNITFSGNKTLTFSGTGDYYFNSITLTSNNTFVFDFLGSTTGIIRIYVLGNMYLDKIGTTIKNGGSENRIFTETNGNTSAFAFTISNGSGATPSRWAGTVWAPYSGINLGSGTGSTLFTGALWSGTQVNTGSGLTINYVRFTGCIDLPTISGTLGVCAGSTTTLTGSGTAASSTPWVSSNTSVATISSTGAVTGVSAGTSIITYTNSNGCSTTATVTVKVTPTISGTLTVCAGSTTALTGLGTPAPTNPWASSNTSVATVSSTGVVTGKLTGTSIITYTNNSGCSKSATVAVNETPAAVSAGVDKPLSFKDTTTLIGTPLSASFSYNWVATDGGVILAPSDNDTINVITTGTYILTVTSSTGCAAKDTVVVTSKDNGIIGSELASMYYNTLSRDPNSPFFTIQPDSVLIDIIAKEGRLNDVIALLTGPTYGLSTQLRSNGNNVYRITGMYPIKNLLLLNALTDIIVYCMPHYSALGGIWPGQARTLGDSAMRSNFIRNGYQLYGEGVKIGVLSDSYNTIPGNPAGVDVSNGDLPGPGNALNTQPVQVTDYPYGQGIDEGRAMLQIIHDIAPKATLEFRTGFISAGDMAAGIRQLKQDGCNVIVDDITHVTEPFLKIGEVAKAVNEVSAQGVAYFSAAGNFANKSYQSIFKAAIANGKAHDFGGGDSLQHLTLKKGDYTIVLQWQDSIYSLGQTQTGGTQNDLDIYLTTNNGLTKFGYNRNNLGGDPIEILPFSINTDVETDLFIVRASGTTVTLPIKYVIFRGEATITEHNLGTSTIVGQANADSAITVGAVRYSKTPVFGTSVPEIELFSSYGSTTRNSSGNIIRNKPDFTAPDGGSTTVTFGNSTNFFGTSAAAPHAAATAALLIQAKKKYYVNTPQEILSVGDLRNILKSSALDMGPAGTDSVSGAGFIRADVAIQSFAAALPALIRLVIPEGVTLGSESFTLGVSGNYLSPSTVVYFNGQPVPTTILTDSTASAVIPTFTGQPPIQAITSSITPSGLDGGSSNILYFNSVVKRNIVVKGKDTTIKYGELIPAFRYSVTVDGQPLENTNLTLASIGLGGANDIVVSTAATSTSSVNNYAITTTIRQFDPNSTTDVNLQKLYNYSVVDGTLTIAKMPIIISANNVSVTYGQTIPDIQFNYVYNNAKIADNTAFLQNIKTLHQAQIIPNTFGVVSAALDPASITGLSFMTSGKLIIGSGKLIIGSGRLIIGSGKLIIGSGMTVIDVPQQSFSNYLASDLNSLVNGKLIIGSSALISGQSTFLNGKLIIGSNVIINSANAGTGSGNNIAVIIDSADLTQSSDTVFTIRSLNLFTGGTGAGSHKIVPGAFVSSNFDVTYTIGDLNIAKATLTVRPDTAFNFKGDKLPAALTYTYDGLTYEDSNVIVNGPTYYVKDANGNVYQPGTVLPNAGVYNIYAQGLQLTAAANNNYNISYVAGVFYVNPQGKDARNVKPNLDCVDTLINDPNGYTHLYRFSYQNPNSSVVYVPRGVNNFITFNGVDYKTRAAGPYGGVQPELFLTSSGKFTIKANGEPSKWTLITYNGNQKSQSLSQVTSASNKCNSGGAGRPIVGNISRQTITSKDVIVYPNPVFDRLVVMFPQSVEAKNEISISDVTGKTYKLKSLQKNADGSFVFKMSNFSKGVYYVKVNSDKNSKVFKIIKL